MNLSGIKVIIWDVDGTLYQTDGLSHKVFESAYKAIEEFTGWSHAQALEEFEKVHGKITLSATEAVAIICKIPTGDAAKLTDKYLDRLQYITKDDELTALFEALSGYTHYILGNGSIGEIKKGITALGLDVSVFKEIVTSEIVGVNKPKDDGFRYIMNRTGLPARAHLMVGDREKVDIEPAKELGMHTCLVWATKPGMIAEITIPTVYELAQILHGN